MNLEENCAAEVRELHAFIQAWMRGSLPRTTKSFERFTDSLADTFVIVHPSGRYDDKTSISEKVFGAHGANPDDFTIEIHDIRVRLAEPPWCLLTYEEHQSDTGNNSARLSSVLFRQTGDRIEWMHLHETRLSEGE